MTDRAIPKNMKIWLFRHSCEKWYGGLQHIPIRAIDHSQNREFTPGNNIETTAIGFGHLFVFVFTSAAAYLKFNPNAGEYRRRVAQLWPLRPDKVTWPPDLLADSDVDRIGGILKEFIVTSSDIVLPEG
jgi:hypothetical protein